MFKNRNFLLGLIVVSVFIASASFTFAYFTVTRAGEQNPKQETVTTGELKIGFLDGPQLLLERAKPGNSVQKTFTVGNTGTLNTNYSIGWKTLTNQITNNEMKLSYTCTSYTNYGQGGQAVSGTCASKTAETIGTSVSTPITSNISINAGITHVYVFTVNFIETGSEQNYNQGKLFSAELKIN